MEPVLSVSKSRNRWPGAMLIVPLILVLAACGGGGGPVSPAGSAGTGEDPTRNLAGLGTWFCNDWDGGFAFADAFKQSRPWQNTAWNAAATVDARGWPTMDASTVIFTGTAAQVNGTYKLIFTGKADVSLMWYPGQVANLVYDPASNTTTAEVSLALSAAGGIQSGGLVFRNTQRTAASPVGSGFTGARLYRPGYPMDGGVFTAPFLAALASARAVRMMDWNGGSSDIVQHWADRATPGSATQGGLAAPDYTAPDGAVYHSGTGVALEHRIQLCNALKADFWLNIPPVADPDYILRIAEAIRYGTDGADPYTADQAAPVYPPLDPGLNVYVEYSNETWNSGGGYATFFIEKAICQALPGSSPLLTVGPASPNIYYTMWRWPAYSIAAISETFRSVFGDAAMMTRVRPVLETQEGDGQGTLSSALQWLDAYAATLPTPRKVSDLIYGGGGSAYYGVNDASSSDPDLFFAGANHPDASTVRQWATDSLWTHNYGIRHVAYEGGPGLAFSDAENRVLNADSRMATLMRTTHDAWSAQGGDLLTYYCVRGPSNWEFTPDISTADSPKLAALAAIAASPRAPVTLGQSLPGTLVVTAPDLPRILYGASGYTTAIGGLSCLAGLGPGASVACPGHTAAAYDAAPVPGTFTVRGYASAATQVGVWVNGVAQGSVSLAAATGEALEDSSSLPINLPPGLAVIRLTVAAGGLTLYSMTVR